MPESKTPEWAMKAVAALNEADLEEKYFKLAETMRCDHAQDECDRIAAEIIAAHAPQAAVSAAPVPEGITPLPWVALPLNLRWHGTNPLFKDGLWHILPEDDVERLPICTVDHANDHHEPTRKQAEIDAKYIVQACNERPALLSALQIAERAIADLLEQFTAYADNNWLGTGKWRNRIGLDEARDNGKQALSTIRALRPKEPAQN